VPGEKFTRKLSFSDQPQVLRKNSTSTEGVTTPRPLSTNSPVVPLPTESRNSSATTHDYIPPAVAVPIPQLTKSNMVAPREPKTVVPVMDRSLRESAKMSSASVELAAEIGRFVEYLENELDSALPTNDLFYVC